MYNRNLRNTSKSKYLHLCNKCYILYLHNIIDTIYLLDLGYIGYLLLYALTLYNIDEEKLVNWGLGNSDLRTIKMVGSICY